jgi:hypothetical protein
VTPEEANKIGYETAMRFTKGQHAFVCCTHTDQEHIHNHILYSAVNLSCDRKFRDSWFCGIGLRRLSDIICLEHGLSVIEPYKHRGIKPKYEKSYRANIREAIDKALSQKPRDFEALLQLLMNDGYEVKRGKHTALRYPGNVGIDGSKPDTHLRRFFGADRIGVSMNSEATEEEVISAVESISNEGGYTKFEIDYLIWAYCASGKGEVCTASPVCNRCVIREYCNKCK